MFVKVKVTVCGVVSAKVPKLCDVLSNLISACAEAVNVSMSTNSSENIFFIAGKALSFSDKKKESLSVLLQK